jgi:hypothetical protein
MSATSAQSRASRVAAAAPSGALPSPAASAYIGVASKTLSNWRALGEGPRYVRLGKPHARVVYRVADLDDYLAERVIGAVR